MIKRSQPKQDREELRSLAHLPAQRERPGVGSFHFRGRMALGGSPSRTDGDVQGQFLVGARGSVRESLEQLQGSGEVTDCLRSRRALHSLQPSETEIFHRLLGVAATTIVMC